MQFFRRWNIIYPIKNEATIQVQSGETITLRTPTVCDGKKMYEIVKESNILDLNSPYSYLLWGKYFYNTSVVAETENENIVGFVSGFLLPESDDTLFVWQVGVKEHYRGNGLATTLIMNVLDRVRNEKGVRYLEATVTPSNMASNKLFTGIARKRNTDCIISECFKEDNFPKSSSHELELLYRIGPIK